MLFFSYSPSWYMLSLFFWGMASSLLLKSLSIRKLLIFTLITEIASFIFVNKYGGLFSIMRTLQFYPYFLAGYIYENKLEHITEYRKSITWGGVIGITFILLTAGRLQHQIDFQRAGLFDLASLTSLNLISLFIFRYMVIVSSVMISATVLLLTYGNNRIKRVATYGHGTLFIYFSHIFIYAVVSRHDLSLPQSLLLTLISLPILTYLSTKKYSILIMNPISSIINKKYK